MVRLTWLNATMLAGGVIITTVAAMSAIKAKMPVPPPPTPPPPMPPPDEIPGIPAAIEFPVYPTSLTQLYGFYYTMDSPAHPQVLRVKPLTSFRGPPYPEGIVAEYVTVRVVDASGRGVPNVTVLIWTVPTDDDQSGQITINGSPRTEMEPMRRLTDAGGEISFILEYQLLDIKVLEDKHNFGCCVPIIGRVKDIDVGQNCELPPPLAWICRKFGDARTDGKVYAVNARIEETVKTNFFVVSCQTIGKALW